MTLSKAVETMVMALTAIQRQRPENPEPLTQGRVDSLPSTPGDPHSPDIGEVEMQDHLDAAVGTAFRDTSGNFPEPAN